MDSVKEKREELIKSKPSFRLLHNSPPVTVKVGSGPTPQYWSLPQALLAHVSPFFRAILSGPWAESQSRSVELEEDYPRAFRLFVHWIFTWIAQPAGQFPTQISDDFDAMDGLRAWVLGDKLGCVLFQDYAMATICWADTDRTIEADFFRQAYARSPPGSTLRRLAACALVWWIDCISSAELDEDPDVQLMNEVDDLAIEVVKIYKSRARGSRVSYFMASEFSDYGCIEREDLDGAGIRVDVEADASR
ncbi:MAG: hypothetical protein Q9207_001103 [Kuettlingeria erythrocarpa]